MVLGGLLWYVDFGGVSWFWLFVRLVDVCVWGLGVL